MPDVFISYSRRDLDFVRRLHAEFEARDQTTWVDWEGIAISTKWLEEIRRGIDEADNFVFVISPDSIQSQICFLELAHAISVSKPIFPIMIRSVNLDEMPEDLATIQYISFAEDENFLTQFDRFLSDLNDDIEWKREHRRLLVLAREWEAHNHNSSYLLTGEALEDMESLIDKAKTCQPQLSQLHEEFIASSRSNRSMERRRLGLQLAAQANLSLYRDPGEALGLALHAVELAPELSEAQKAQKTALMIIDRRLGVTESDRINWDSGSAFVPLAGPYFKGKLPARQSVNGRYTLVATERGEHGNKPPGEAYLLDNEALKVVHLEPRQRKDSIKRRLEYLGFGSSQKVIYLARQFNIEIYDINGDFIKDFYVASTKYPISLVDGVDNDRRIIVGDSTGPVWILDVESENCLHQFFKYATHNPLISFDISPSGKAAVMLLREGIAHLWWVEHEMERFPHQINHKGKVRSVLFSPLSEPHEVLLTCGDDGIVNVWEIGQSKAMLISTLDHNGERVGHATFLSETGELLTVSSTKKPRIWDVKTWKLIRTVERNNQNPSNRI